MIGDIHGCYLELVDLLTQIGVSQQDRIISVGDLITKGPGNQAVLHFFRQRPNCESVLGNHEYLLLQHRRGEPADLKAEHFQTITELGKDFEDHMNWLSRLPPYIDLGDHLVVHAGIRPNRPLEKQHLEDLIQLRTLDGPEAGNRNGTPWFEEYQGDKTVIFGHWVFDVPLLRENAIGLDTGCVYGGRLTAVILPARQIVSVPARRAYAKKKG